MNAGHLKTEAMCFLRYSKQLDYVCTEAGYWSADVIGATENMIVEVEVKTSRADMKAEFRKKQDKHTYYKQYTNWAPNYFYFMVPPELVPDALDILKDEMPKAGLLTYQYPKKRHGDRTRIVKGAQALHKTKPIDKFLRSIKRRMASELCGMHITLDEYPNLEIATVEEVKVTILKAITDTLGLEEWEKLNVERKPLQDPGGAVDDPPPHGS